MNTDPAESRPDRFLLPEGIKLRRKKFGTKPFSEFLPTPDVGSKVDDGSRPRFQLRWEDQAQGLTVFVHDRQDDHLIADVFCTDAGLLNKAAVSVALLGTTGEPMIRKTIPLKVPEERGCSGTADLGSLADAVQKLGPKLALIVFLLL